MNGQYKVFSDPNFGAILITDEQTLALPGKDGRYAVTGAQTITLQDLDDASTLRQTGDVTLQECFDAHQENRKPRFL